jgi:hypothetical protein
MVGSNTLFKIFLVSVVLIYFSLFSLHSINPTIKKHTISGYVKDGNSGEVLIGSTVYIRELKTGLSTNQYGFYSLSLTPGKYNIDFSYIGFQTTTQEIDLKESIVLTIELQNEAKQIGEVVIRSDRPQDKIKRAEMSINKLEMKTIKRIPALMGEVDVIKAIQLLPGVQSSSEGSSNFSVRGGGVDQNLILLDEATVYNASHLLGFFSVFNNDAVKDVKLYKGDIPAAYGGRLSSLLDVRMKEGNAKKISATGGIGLISSRLTFEGPIIRDKSSFIVSARRTYIDIFFPLLSKMADEPNLKNARLYFYDLNMKLNYTLNDNNKIFFSAYGGKDLFGSKDTVFNTMFSFGNNTFTFRWNHQFSGRLFSNVSLIASNYTYELGNYGNTQNSIIWSSGMWDYTAKLDFNYFANTNNNIKFGISTTYHTFDPGYIRGIGTKTIFNSYQMPKHYALEHAIYLSNEQNITEKLSFKYGIRLPMFQNMGKDLVYNYDENYRTIDSTVYKSGDIYNTYFLKNYIEPRLAANYKLNEVSSVKGSYSRTVQFIQLASNSLSGTPLDIWFPASPNVKPQIADQYAVGYIRNLFDDKLETSVELYYKKLKNVIDFRDNAQLFLNDKVEGELRYGHGQAYGAEFMIQYTFDRFNGWVSYTYSKSERTVQGFSVVYPKGWTTYPSPYEKPNSLNVVFNFTISNKYNFSANWMYASGAPITYPKGKAKIGNVSIPVYTNRLGDRMPAYHRLDVSFSIKNKHYWPVPWEGEWNFSVYNAYARHNPWSINPVQDQIDPRNNYFEMTYLFSFIPAITYNFSF